MQGLTLRRGIMFSVRGATTAEYDTKEEIDACVKELILNIIKKNDILIDDIISIIFTCTIDLKSAYPAEAVREMGIKHAGLLCLQEMNVENSLKGCIRVLILVNKDKPQNQVRHIYLRKAVNLRRDLLKDF